MPKEKDDDQRSKALEVTEMDICCPFHKFTSYMEESGVQTTNILHLRNFGIENLKRPKVFLLYTLGY